MVMINSLEKKNGQGIPGYGVGGNFSPAVNGGGGAHCREIITQTDRLILRRHLQSDVGDLYAVSVESSGGQV